MTQAIGPKLKTTAPISQAIDVNAAIKALNDGQSVHVLLKEVGPFIVGLIHAADLRAIDTVIRSAVETGRLSITGGPPDLIDEAKDAIIGVAEARHAEWVRGQEKLTQKVMASNAWQTNVHGTAEPAQPASPTHFDPSVGGGQVITPTSLAKSISRLTPELRARLEKLDFYQLPSVQPDEAELARFSVETLRDDSAADGPHIEVLISRDKVYLRTVQTHAPMGGALPKDQWIYRYKDASEVLR